MIDATFQLLEVQLVGVKKVVFTDRAKSFDENHGRYVFKYANVPIPTINITVPASVDYSAFLALIQNFFAEDIAEGKTQLQAEGSSIVVIFLKA